MASTSGRPGNLTDSQQAALSALWERSVTWQPQPIVLWGTPLTKELGLRQKIILCKFLRARNWDVDKADAMFQACLKVRAPVRHADCPVHAIWHCSAVWQCAMLTTCSVVAQGLQHRGAGQ
jgi:hypothetical protein